MIRRFVALALVLLAGCSGSETITDAGGELLFEQDAITFPRTFVGYPNAVGLRVSNTGQVPIAIELDIRGNFSCERAKWVVAGGDRLSIPIRFDPQEAGAHRGELELHYDGNEKIVPLSGQAEIPPPCAPMGPCYAATFNPDTGECRQTGLPDNTPCVSGNQCQVQEKCIDQVCVGTPRNCDDDNVCTMDGCDPAVGCFHVDQTAACPQPGNPCKVAICDRRQGCGFADAPDIVTACGPADCREALVCIGGSCERVDVPDGTECIDSCGMGVCQAGECERRDGDRLEPLWSYQVPTGRTIDFAGISDGAGQVYWLEEDGGGAILASATAGGIVRYQVRTSIAGTVGERGLVLEEGILLVAGEREAVVQAFLPTDGSSPWTRDLTDQICCEFEGGALTRSTANRVAYSAILHSNGQPLHQSALVMLRASSGEVAWKRNLAGTLVAPPIADESGNFYLLLESPGGARTFVSIDPEGREVLRLRDTDAALPLAAWNGTVHLAPDLLLELSEPDEPALALGYGDANATAPLHGTAGIWAFTRSAAGNLMTRTFEPDGTPVAMSLLFDPVSLSGRPTWSDAVVTSRNNALIALNVPVNGLLRPRLVEIQPDGELKRMCTLDVDGEVVGPFSLRAGKWVVKTIEAGRERLRAYAVPHGDVAPIGWVGPHGNPAGGGRPQ